MIAISSLCYKIYLNISQLKNQILKKSKFINIRISDEMTKYGKFFVFFLNQDTLNKLNKIINLYRLN
jgi:hypothetical protein